MGEVHRNGYIPVQIAAGEVDVCPRSVSPFSVRYRVYGAVHEAERMSKVSVGVEWFLVVATIAGLSAWYGALFLGWGLGA